MLLRTAKTILVCSFAFWGISESKSVYEEKDTLPLEDPNFCQRSCIQVNINFSNVTPNKYASKVGKFYRTFLKIILGKMALF